MQIITNYIHQKIPNKINIDKHDIYTAYNYNSKMVIYTYHMTKQRIYLEKQGHVLTGSIDGTTPCIVNTQLSSIRYLVNSTNSLLYSFSNLHVEYLYTMWQNHNYQNI